jgi:hypothetical protein
VSGSDARYRHELHRAKYYHISSIVRWHSVTASNMAQRYEIVARYETLDAKTCRTTLEVDSVIDTFFYMFLVATLRHEEHNKNAAM